MQCRKVIKGLLYNHQRFSLNIDFSARRLIGYTELHVFPHHDKLTELRINCRQCQITSASVNSVPTTFQHNDQQTIVQFPTNKSSVLYHREFRRRYVAALQAGDEGELILKIPQGLATLMKNNDYPITKTSPPQPNQTQSDNIQDSSQTSGAAPSFGMGNNYSQLVVRVEFKVENPRLGVIFVDSDPIVAPHRYPHLYTVNHPIPGSVRTWLPCLDKLSERCTWEMEFVVPRQWVESDFNGPLKTNETDQETPITIVCSGDLVEQVTHPYDSSKKIVRYTLRVPTPAPFIGFAMGAFEMIRFSSATLSYLPTHSKSEAPSHTQSPLSTLNPDCIGFCLPGREEELKNTCSFLPKAINFYAQEAGSYPFTDHKIVFVEDSWCSVINLASLSICSTHLLYSRDVIDQVYETHRYLSLALTSQWFGIHIIPKTPPDTWLIVGLAHYLASLHLKKRFGNNEYRFRLKKDIKRCCELDIGRHPLYYEGFPTPVDPEDLSFTELKAPLVLWMLDKRMRKGGATVGLSRVIPKLLVSVISGELPQNALATGWFLKICKKVSGLDTKSFSEQWIRGSGCPVFSFSYNFNRKKLLVEIHMEQQNTNNGEVQASEPIGEMGNQRPTEKITPLFTGQMTARIHEADGAEYEHILDIQTNATKFEVQFNTKYKRIRRNTKRFQAKQQAAAAAAAAEDEMDATEGEPNTLSSGVVALGLGLGLWETEEQKEDWKIVEWGEGEDDTTGAASATFDWIRLDAEAEWLCRLEFRQPDYMWAAQLLKDRDVIAQYEALQALKTMPSATTATSLLKALMDQKCFYRIRMESAYALATCATEKLKWVGLFQLTKAFQKRYCYSASPEGIEDDFPVVPCIPRPNNFATLTEYFVQKAIPIAVSQVRNKLGHAPLKVKQFLIDLLRYNDNTGNQFSDNYYISTVITALSQSLIPCEPSEELSNMDVMDLEEDDANLHIFEEARREIERYRTLDYLIPTYHNTVTVSSLKASIQLMATNLIKPDFSVLFAHSRYGNFLDVRLAAFEGLLLLDGLRNSEIIDYLCTVIREDPYPFVRYYVSKGFVEVLGLIMSKGKNASLDTIEDFIIEEEGKVEVQHDRKQRQSTLSFSDAVEAARKVLGGNLPLQISVWKILNADSYQDHRVRKHLLNFCDILYKPVDVPRLKFRMPSLSDQGSFEGEAPVSIAPNAVSSEPSKIPAREDKNKPSLAASKERPSVPHARKPNVVVEKPNIKKPLEKPSANPPKIQPDDSKKLSMSSTDEKRCRRALRKLESQKLAIIFSKPVDPIADGAPNYFDIIKNPMDISTVKSKLNSNKYNSAQEFEDDIRLMFANCYLFNPVGTPVYNTGQALETIFDKEWFERKKRPEEEVNLTIVESSTGSQTNPHASSSTPSTSQPLSTSTETLTSRTYDKCKLILTTLMQHEAAFEFLRPVDPLKQGIPTYLDVIKKPMDLGTVQARLRKRKYTTAEAFRQDIELIFNNCFIFNKPGTYVYTQAEKLQKVFEKEWVSCFGSTPDVTTGSKEKVNKSDPIKPETIKNKANPKARAPEQRHRTDVSGNGNIGLSFSSSTRLAGTGTDMTKDNFKRCEDILNQLVHHPLSKGFRLPVDPVALGIPSYLEIIRRPMDFSTIQSQLSANKYSTLDEFERDIRQIFWNCYKFNTPESIIFIEGQALESFFNQIWSAHFARKDALSSEQKEIAHKIVQRLVQGDANVIFVEPVDWEALAIPLYPVIIKFPIDLRTISEKIESGKYSNLEEVADDIRLMFSNCFKFNKIGSFAHGEGKKLERLFNTVWKEFSKSIEQSSSPVGSKLPLPENSSIVPIPSEDEKTGIPKKRKKDKEKKKKKKKHKHHRHSHGVSASASPVVSDAEEMEEMEEEIEKMEEG